jgi:N6-adenosine-specific RNA methylase IME4
MHEILLVGVRGKPPCPADGTQWDSVIEADRGAHSAKPEIFLEMIEQYFPTLPKIELNRRGPPRPGWDAWGLEAEVNEPTVSAA